MIRAVIDTNVLVSGLLSPNGNEALVLLAIHQGLLHPCFSDAILDEYTAVLGRPRFGFSPEEIEALLLMFRARGEFFQPEASFIARWRPGRIIWSPVTGGIFLTPSMA